MKTFSRPAIEVFNSTSPLLTGAIGLYQVLTRLLPNQRQTRPNSFSLILSTHAHPPPSSLLLLMKSLPSSSPFLIVLLPHLISLSIRFQSPLNTTILGSSMLATFYEVRISLDTFVFSFSTPRALHPAFGRWDAVAGKGGKYVAWWGERKGMGEWGGERGGDVG